MIGLDKHRPKPALSDPVSSRPLLHIHIDLLEQISETFSSFLQPTRIYSRFFQAAALPASKATTYSFPAFMATRGLSVAFAALLFSLSAVTASPQGPPGGFGGGSNPNDGGSDSGSGSGSDPNGSESDFGSRFGQKNVNHVIVIHAVLAALAWVIVMPIGAILLRLNIQSPIILKLHAACQIIGYIVYFVAAGMGIWIVRQTSDHFNLYSDPHPVIGLVILAVALFQPLWGIIHHRKFKSGLAAWKAGRATQKPGRTGFGRLHLWIGRILITLAMVNGGLGFRLASESPFPPAQSAKIAYSVVAAVMWLLYITIVSVFEARKTTGKRGSGTQEERYALKRGEPPTYDESRESL